MDWDVPDVEDREKSAAISTGNDAKKCRLLTLGGFEVSSGKFLELWFCI